MDGITTWEVQATTNETIKVFAAGHFVAALGGYIVLDSAGKGGTYGPDVISATRTAAGIYVFGLLKPYPLLLNASMAVDGTNGAVFGFMGQPDLFDAPSTISLPTAPSIRFNVSNTTSGALADPGAGVLFTLELTFRNRSVSM